MTQELSAPGTLTSTTTYPFEFKQVEKKYESYLGINVKLRYLLRCTLLRRMSHVIKEREMWVNTFPPAHHEDAVKMEVGIEDCLHIEFEYEKATYHLRDVVIGRIYFLMVRVKVVRMELSILRRETTGSGTTLLSL